MRSPRELLQPGVVKHLAGVIDLRAGVAVHAIAGQRERYLPLAHPALTNAGDANSLAAFYASLGVRRLYIADLDAIENRPRQVDALRSLLESCHDFDEVLIDLGWRDDDEPAKQVSTKRLLDDFPRASLVIATETAGLPQKLMRSVELLGHKMWLGLDYRGGHVIPAGTHESDWLAAASAAGMEGVVILDVFAVGTAAGPRTLEICQRIRRTFPQFALASGGGVRDPDDVSRLLAAGCDLCLVATALLKN